jgi:hypothetical protein
MTIFAVATVAADSTREPLPLRSVATQRAAPANVRLPDEAVGIDEIVRALISVYDQFDVVALGESHERKVESDLRVALVRHPDFAKKVRTIVVEFASTTEQATLDRYIRGENVPRAQFERVWKNTSQFGELVSQNPFYTDLFTAVREVNSRLPADARIRVFGGDPGPGDGNRDAVALSVLKQQALQKHGKALAIYGAGHFYRALPKAMLSRSGGGTAGIVRTLEMEYPGRTFSMIPVGGQRETPPWAVTPDYQKFDRALTTKVRPVMVSLNRWPFSDFTAEEFLGGDICTVGAGGCTSAFKGSTLTLGQIADAAFYYPGGR